MQDYRKPKQAMEARREKRRGRGRPRKTWEDCVIDAAWRRGKTFVELKTQHCKAIGIDKEEDEVMPPIDNLPTDGSTDALQVGTCYIASFLSPQLVSSCCAKRLCCCCA
jgi:hypothetical protein